MGVFRIIHISLSIHNTSNWFFSLNFVQRSLKQQTSFIPLWGQFIFLLTWLIYLLIKIVISKKNNLILCLYYRGLTDESEILKFLQHGTLVGLLPVPHPILIRKYQANSGTTTWFRTYMWGVIYLRYISSLIILVLVMLCWVIITDQ